MRSRRIGSPCRHSITSGSTDKNNTRNAMRRRDRAQIRRALGGRRAVAASLRAQDRYPSRPVHLFIPATPGGVHDIIGRVWAEKIKPHFGTIVIDNRGGGGGTIAATEVAHAQPDGYSLLLGSTTTHVLVPPPRQPALRSGEGLLDDVGHRPTARPRSWCIRRCRRSTLQELIAYAKANPKQAVLRVGRQRHDHQSGGRTVQAARRWARHRAHPLQGHRPGHGRP